MPRDYEARIAVAPQAPPEKVALNDDDQETTMKLTKMAAMLALTMGMAGAQFGATPAFAAGPDEREVWEMLKKSGMKMRSDGMVMKADFLKIMGQRFDMMDKGKKGMLSAADIAKLLDPNLANP